MSFTLLNLLFAGSKRPLEMINPNLKTMTDQLRLMLLPGIGSLLSKLLVARRRNSNEVAMLTRQRT